MLKPRKSDSNIISNAGNVFSPVDILTAYGFSETSNVEGDGSDMDAGSSRVNFFGTHALDVLRNSKVELAVEEINRMVQNRVGLKGEFTDFEANTFLVDLAIERHLQVFKIPGLANSFFKISGGEGALGSDHVVSPLNKYLKSDPEKAPQPCRAKAKKEVTLCIHIDLGNVHDCYHQLSLAGQGTVGPFKIFPYANEKTIENLLLGEDDSVIRIKEGRVDAFIAFMIGVLIANDSDSQAHVVVTKSRAIDNVLDELRSRDYNIVKVSKWQELLPLIAKAAK